MDEIKAAEEKLREAACNGDEEVVQNLIATPGLDVNSQHNINGWTALHWAAKRNHQRIVDTLLKCGADKEIRNGKGESAIQLTTNPTIRVILGGEANNGVTIPEEPLPITPNYLAHPTFPYHSRTSKQRSMHTDSPSGLSVGQADPRHHHHSPGQTSSSLYNQPYHNNMNVDDDDLVLKARVANAVETDFIEVELDRRRLTFDGLLSVMCKELEIKRELVTKVRKLPDTIVRKDKDVRRLRDFQELELVLSNRAMSESSRNYTSAVSPKHVDVVY